MILTEMQQNKSYMIEKFKQICKSSISYRVYKGAWAQRRPYRTLQRY